MINPIQSNKLYLTPEQNKKMREKVWLSLFVDFHIFKDEIGFYLDKNNKLDIYICF